MKMNSKKKFNTAMAACLVIVIAIGATFAYWTQTSTVENPFDTSKYGSTIREDFEPDKGEEWQPGVRVEKKVRAINTGDTDLIIRAKMDETWTRKSDATADAGVKYKDSSDSTNGFNVYATAQDNATDGLTALDGSVVTKHLNKATDKWIDGGDGWYYYRVNLKGGETSDDWLDAVELLGDADMGKMETRKYVSVDDDPDEEKWNWIEYTGKMPIYIDGEGKEVGKDAPGAQKVLHNKTETKYVQADQGGVMKDLLGYSQSDYKLTVTTQTVQATKEAIDAVFGEGQTFTIPNNCTWELKDK